MRFFSITLTLTALLLLFIAGCDSAITVNNQTPSEVEAIGYQPDDEAIQAVIGDPAFLDIQKIMREVLDAYVSTGVTGEDIMKFYEKDDLAGAASALGLSVDAINTLHERYKENVASLKERHALLRNEDFMSSCATNSTVSELAAATDKVIESQKSINSTVSELAVATDRAADSQEYINSTELDDDANYQKACGGGGDVTCMWPPLIVCAGLDIVGCVATGAWCLLLGPAGAYVCVCGFCSGGWVDTICGGGGGGSCDPNYYCCLSAQKEILNAVGLR